jgi:hypothetical protein
MRGIAGNCRHLQKFAGKAIKTAKNDGRTVPENIFQDIQEIHGVPKGDHATFCNLFERKMT